MDQSILVDVHQMRLHFLDDEVVIEEPYNSGDFRSGAGSLSLVGRPSRSRSKKARMASSVLLPLLRPRLSFGERKAAGVELARPYVN
jgi:hypothetical protein